MGMVYRKSYTMPVPRDAELVEQYGRRIARWRLRNGQLRSGEVVDCQNDKTRVRGRSKFYMARYRDGNGHILEVATQCKDRMAAQAVLAKFERQAELIRAGVMTDAEGEATNHARQPLSFHLDAYERHLQAKGGNPRRISMVRSRIERLSRDCRCGTLNKMAAGSLEEWLVKQTGLGMAPATRNGYRESAVGFGNWCRRTHRLTRNPFSDVPRADQNSNRPHQRRALTEAELLRLLKVARLRPLAEYGRKVVHRPPDGKDTPRSRATWKREALSFENIDESAERAREALKENPGFIAELEGTGRERALVYKTLVLTGLRKSELASLTAGQLEFAGPVAYASLNPEDEKNRKGANIPLRADLAAELSARLNEQLAEYRAEARNKFQAIPARLPASTPLFYIPSGLSRILNRDLAAAGIPKRDGRNRVVDVHAMRVTFGTHLCAAGVPLRTAQAAMRHSKPELTANIYTDPALLDVAGAINALPSLGLDPASAAERARAEA